MAASDRTPRSIHSRRESDPAPGRCGMRQMVRRQHLSEAHASPPHNGLALPLNCGEADNPGTADRPDRPPASPNPAGFSNPERGALTASPTHRWNLSHVSSERGGSSRANQSLAATTPDIVRGETVRERKGVSAEFPIGLTFRSVAEATHGLIRYDGAPPRDSNLESADSRTMVVVVRG